MKNVKKLLSVLMMLIAWLVYCQDDILPKKDSVKLSFETAKKINLDLIDYDRLIENKVEFNLKECLVLQSKKDSLNRLITSQVNEVEKQLKIQEYQTSIIEDKLEFTRKKKSKGLMWGLVGLALGVTTMAVIN